MIYLAYNIETQDESQMNAPDKLRYKQLNIEPTQFETGKYPAYWPRELDTSDLLNHDLYTGDTSNSSVIWLIGSSGRIDESLAGSTYECKTFMHLRSCLSRMWIGRCFTGRSLRLEENKLVYWNRMHSQRYCTDMQEENFSMTFLLLKESTITVNRIPGRLAMNELPA